MNVSEFLADVSLEKKDGKPAKCLELEPEVKDEEKEREVSLYAEESNGCLCLSVGSDKYMEETNETITLTMKQAFQLSRFLQGVLRKHKEEEG